MKILSNISIFLIIAVIDLSFINPVFAGPTSSSFELKDYGFGSGGVATSSYTNYMFQGITGEVETASLSSTNFVLGPGLTYTLQPNTPAAPSFTNPASYYNKLHIVIDNGGNSTDTTFAIQVSTDNFVSDLNYVQADQTLAANSIWQTYASWNSGTGFDIIGLTPGVTYYARVAAKRGTFTQGAYGAPANASTINPTFTFSLQTSSQSSPPFSVDIGNLTAGQITTSPDTVTTTISTNAANGGLIYIYGINTGLKSTTSNHTIDSVSNSLSSVLEGYGARGTTSTQTSGGPMEIVSPYDGAGQNVGILDSSERLFADSTEAPVTNGQATFELKAKASNTTPSATDYADTLTLVATGSF